MGLSSLNLHGRVAVVIGGTLGLGCAAALALAEAGADVIASARRQEGAEAIAVEIEQLGVRTVRQTVDATSRASIDDLRDALLNEFGHVDILVNAVGKTEKKAAVEFTEEQWYEIIDANFTATLRACQSFYPLLMKSGHGPVINITSLSSFRGCYQIAPYASASCGCGADSNTRNRMDARRYSCQCCCSGCVSDSAQRALVERHSPGQGNAHAHAAPSLWQTGRDWRRHRPARLRCS